MSNARSPLMIERILREREDVWRQVHSSGNLRGLIGQMLLTAAVALGCYGAVLGAQGEALQILASAVKMPVLFLLTLLICLPTLYLFNLVLGARLSILQAMALVCAAVTVIAVLALAFAPISLFFLVTAPNYAFYKVLNVAILALAGIVGLGVLIDGMRTLNRLATPAQPAAEEPAVVTPPPVGEPVMVPPLGLPRAAAPRPASDQPVNMGLVRVWVLLFGFVGTQLAWTLRPFVGEPHQPFQWFRAIEGNFYVNVVHTLGSIFS